MSILPATSRDSTFCWCSGCLWLASYHFPSQNSFSCLQFHLTGSASPMLSRALPHLTQARNMAGWMRCSLRLTLRWKSLQEDRNSLCLSWVSVGLTISLTSIAILAGVWRNGLCGPERPVYINVNSETSRSRRGVASDVFLQAFWLRRGRFLCDLTQLSMCLCRPQENRQLPGTLPASRRRPVIPVLPSTLWLSRLKAVFAWMF